MNEDQEGALIDFKEEVTAMCDYSLHQYRNRLALGGETLVIYRFPSSTLGLASPADLQAIADQKSDRRPPRFWLGIVAFFSARGGKKAPAVCVPPGAGLGLGNIPDP